MDADLRIARQAWNKGVPRVLPGNTSMKSRMIGDASLTTKAHKDEARELEPSGSFDTEA